MKHITAGNGPGAGRLGWKKTGCWDAACSNPRSSCRRPASPLAECQSGEVLVNGGEKGLCAREAQGDMAGVEVLHVMAGLEVLMHISFACMSMTTIISPAEYVQGCITFNIKSREYCQARDQ